MVDTAGFWDSEASSFDDEADHGLRDPAVRDARRALLRSVLPAPPTDVVDVGCGTGSLAVLLAQAGYAVTGIDFSRAMLAAASRKAADAGVAVTFRRESAPPAANGRTGERLDSSGRPGDRNPPNAWLLARTAGIDQNGGE